MSNIIQPYSAIGNKDLLLYTIANSLKQNGWDVKAVQGAGYFNTLAINVNPFGNFHFHTVTTDNFGSGIIIFPTQGDSDAFLDSSAAPMSIVDRYVIGSYSSSVARGLVLQALNKLTIAERWVPGASTSLTPANPSISISQAITYSIPEDSQDFFQIDTPGTTILNNVSIGSSLRNSWSAPAGGGYVCRSAAFGNSQNRITLFLNTGQPDTISNNPLWYVTQEAIGINPHPFYVKPADASSDQFLGGHQDSFLLFHSPTNFWMTCDNFVAGRKPQSFVSVVYPDGNFTKCAFACAQSVTTDGLKTSFSNSHGIWGFRDSTYFAVGFSIQVPYLKTYSTANPSKAWLNGAYECIECYALIKEVSGSQYSMLGQLKDIIIAAARPTELSDDIPFDAGIYRKYSSGTLNTMLVDIS